MENSDAADSSECGCGKQKNNSELVKAVKTLKDQDSKYIIVFDNAFDNPQVYQEQRRLKKYAETSGE